VVGRPLVRSAASVVLLLTAPLACQQHATSPATDAGRTDSGLDGGSSDGGSALPSLGISVTGCVSLDYANRVCMGSAPLSLSFAPVGSAAFTQFLWSFGDGTPPSTAIAPMHTFTLPSPPSTPPSYQVFVTGQLGSTGGALSSAPYVIQVAPVSAGAACDVDKQCMAGLQCLCQVGSGCGPAFSRGVCSTTCATGFCGSGAVCADYALGPTAGDGGAATPVCLGDCSGSSTCGPGFVCQQAPGGPSGPAWVQTCLPIGAANDFGLSCRDANGVLQNSACATGLCADVGTLGMCTATCDGTHPCPTGAACARLPGGAELCLPACSATDPCASDPGLACTTPTDAGVDGGLAIIAGAAGGSYCAPR
jgi:hypothetical protein